MDFVDTLQYDKRIIQTSEDIYPFSIRYPNAAMSKNLFSILSSLNSFEQGKYDFNTFRQFKVPLKDQKNSGNTMSKTLPIFNQHSFNFIVVFFNLLTKKGWRIVMRQSFNAITFRVILS